MRSGISASSPELSHHLSHSESQRSDAKSRLPSLAKKMSRRGITVAAAEELEEAEAETDADLLELGDSRGRGKGRRGARRGEGAAFPALSSGLGAEAGSGERGSRPHSAAAAAGGEGGGGPVAKKKNSTVLRRSNTKEFQGLVAMINYSAKNSNKGSDGAEGVLKRWKKISRI
jgi:hypothetical protein